MVGRGDDPHVHLKLPRFPDRLRISLLKHPQQLDLARAGLVSPNLVEKMVPAVRHFEEAFFRGDRASAEGPLHGGTEKFRFQ